MKCPKCGTDQVDGKPYCPSCGNKYGDPPPPPPPDPTKGDAQTVSLAMAIVLILLILLGILTGRLPIPI